MTSLLDGSNLLVPVVGGLFFLGLLLLYSMFLFTLTECLEKVRHHNRMMSPGKVWLNLIPLFGMGWMFVTAARLGDSVKAQLEDNHPDDEPGDGGKMLGLAFAFGFLCSHIPGLNLIAIIPTLIVGVIYWCKVVRMSKQLDNGTEGVFWKKYNDRLEFPLSVAVSILGVSLLFFGVMLILVAAMLNAKDKKSVPIRLVEGGFDDAGDGSPGSGGQEDPLAVGAQAPKPEDFKNLALPQELPEVKEEIKKAFDLDDPSTSIPDEKAAAYATLDKAMLDKMMGQKRGAGGGPGSGDSGQAGAGPGGTGADSTRARSMRWVLRFRTKSGRDYLDQLMSLKAVVLVPVPPDNKQAHIFRDLQNPKPGTFVTDTEWAQLRDQIQFCDFKRDSATQVGAALGLPFTPTAFWAFFPKDLEGELTRLETGYRNRRPENIEETVFQVTIRAGKYQMIVSDQKAKR